jgi:hypothetical protein
MPPSTSCAPRHKLRPRLLLGRALAMLRDAAQRNRGPRRFVQYELCGRVKTTTKELGWRDQARSCELRAATSLARLR